ncbi:helix-turn-helix transcriptional regulator [bacterium]|nr:helix-turn-helix transcriptional regulator [bacterium]
MDEKTIKKLLGLRIKQLRKKCKLTQFAMGEQIGIDQRQIAYIEGGNSFPSLKTLNKFTEIFHCEIKDLFDFGHLIPQQDIKEKIDKKISALDEKNLNLYYNLITVLSNNT